MANSRPAETETNLVPADVNQPIRALVIDGKPLPLSRQIMGAANDAERRIDLLSDAVHACSQALTTGTITETKANRRMRQISALDGSEDHNILLEALKKLEEAHPAECQTIICSLSATTILGLAQPDTELGAFIVENTTSGQLASVANLIAGKVFASEQRQREAERKRGLFGQDRPIPNISDDPELAHFRQKARRRELGQLLDLIAETGDESLEKFGLAIIQYLHEPDGFSPLFDAICQLALADNRESAIDIVAVLPKTPRITKLKIELGLKDE